MLIHYSIAIDTFGFAFSISLIVSPMPELSEWGISFPTLWLIVPSLQKSLAAVARLRTLSHVIFAQATVKPEHPRMRGCSGFRCFGCPPWTIKH